MQGLYSFHPAQYEVLWKILKSRTGMDLAGYREGVAGRRVARRVRATKCDSIEEYFELLKGDQEEADELFNQITIHVSHFFRNPEVFELLGSRIINEVFSSVKPGEDVKLWSAGCAEGEEAYSLAILLLKRYANKLAEHSVKIIATDVNPRNLEMARSARYEDKRVALVDDSLKKRYFKYSKGMWKLKPRVREQVEFRRENLLDGEGVPGADIVLARNVLIYFSRHRQEKLLERLVTCLKPGGYLVLGKSETLPAFWRKDLQSVAPRQRIYRKNVNGEAAVERKI